MRGLSHRSADLHAAFSAFAGGSGCRSDLLLSTYLRFRLQPITNITSRIAATLEVKFEGPNFNSLFAIVRL